MGLRGARGSELERAIVASPKLPSMSGVQEFVDEIASFEDTDLTGLSLCISRDDDLSNEIARLVNDRCAETGHGSQSLREAVLLLGIGKVRCIALALAFLSRFRRNVLFRRGIDFLWRQALYSAVAAREISRVLRTWDEDEAILAGLVADSGAIVMYRLVPG